MKYCPVCSERYDEEIIRFCTKDGSPLLDDEQPSFIAMPRENVSEPDDEFGQETIIRRKPLISADQPIGFDSQGQSERIVIPTAEPVEHTVRTRASQAYYPPPPESNTGKTVVLTILGTLAVLGFGAGIFWLLQKDAPANVNTTSNLQNQSVNLNTNIGFDSNFNFNAISNLNTNFNTSSNFNTSLNSNVNARTPSPTPSPKPSPTTTPTANVTPNPAPSATPRPLNTNRPAGNANVAPTGTPRTGPRPPAINRPPINGN